jgi:hypothetical protein
VFQVEFAYNATRALGIGHTPFEANLSFSPEEPLDMLFSMRLSIPVSQDATERLKLLYELPTLVSSVFLLHDDEMQARLEPSTAPHFIRGDKVTVVTKNLFLRGQPNRNLRDRHVGPFTVEEQFGNTQLQIEITNESSFTSRVSCQQSKTMLYDFSSARSPCDYSRR